MKSGNKFRGLFIFSMVLAGLLSLSLTGCGSSQPVTVEGIIQNINVETQTLQIETRDKKVVNRHHSQAASKRGDCRDSYPGAGFGSAGAERREKGQTDRDQPGPDVCYRDPGGP